MVFLLQSHIKTKLRHHNRFVCRYVYRTNWDNSHNSADLHIIAFINLQLLWTAQLKLLQVYLPVAQSQQHWATEAQSQKPLFCHSQNSPQDTPCWTGHRGPGRKRSATKAKGITAAWDPAERSCHSFAPPFTHHICYSSGIITIVITTEYFHSINVIQFACKCIVSAAALILGTSPLYLHISASRGHRLFPWHHFWKETAASHCINLYWFIQQQKPKSVLEKMLMFLKLSFKDYKINCQKSINVPIHDFLHSNCGANPKRCYPSNVKMLWPKKSVSYKSDFQKCQIY